MSSHYLFFSGLVRLSLGWIFLWAFLDKIFGWGFATEHAKSWLDGVSPTIGYLKFATHGPLAPFFQSIAGQPVVDWLFMTGLLFVGLTLIFGVMVRLGSLSGIAILLLIYFSAIPPKHNPFMDDHLVYSLVMASFIYSPVGEKFGFGRWWSSLSFVKKHPSLR